jgi:ubiquitin-conjugating enzyme E2 I
VCLSILDDQKEWKPSITVKQILVGVQELLESPNNDDPAQSEASAIFSRSTPMYEQRVREQAARFAAEPFVN